MATAAYAPAAPVPAASAVTKIRIASVKLTAYRTPLLGGCAGSNAAGGGFQRRFQPKQRRCGAQTQSIAVPPARQQQPAVALPVHPRALALARPQPTVRPARKMGHQTGHGQTVGTHQPKPVLCVAQQPQRRQSCVAASLPGLQSAPLASARATAIAPAEALPAPDVVLCLGDSLTQGPKEQPSKAYPQLLEAMLQSAGHSLRVENAGSWGETTEMMLRRLPKVLQSCMARGGRLAFVLILGGTNDILQANCRRGMAQQVLVRLQQLYEGAANCAFRPKVGILTLPPVFIADGDSERLHLNAALRRLPSLLAGGGAGKAALSSSVLDSRHFLVDLEGVDRAHQYDGVHFNYLGYAEFANRAFAAMEPILKAEAASRARLQKQMLGK